jgi:hypothetical protein
VHAEGVGIVARVGLLVQAQLVLKENAAIAQRGTKETHHEGTGVVDEARRRSDDDEASYCSRGDACGEEGAWTKIQQSISTMLRARKARNRTMTNTKERSSPTIEGLPKWSHSMTIHVKAQVEAQRWVISAAIPAWVPGILRITQSKCLLS